MNKSFKNHPRYLRAIAFTAVNTKPRIIRVGGTWMSVSGCRVRPQLRQAAALFVCLENYKAS